METNQLIKHLASVLGDNFNLSLEDVDKEESEADKEVIYGLICLHEDLAFYKKKSDHLLDNFKTTLFNSAAITITGSNGVIKDLNDSFSSLSGYSKEELIGKRLDMIDSDSNQPSEYGSMRSDIIQGKTWRGEVLSISKNKELFWLSTVIFPIKNTEGDIYEYWSLSTDITSQKEVQLKLVDKNNQLEQYSYLLSNNLKAPGRQIDQLAGFIEEDHGDSFNDDCKDMFKLLRSRALRLNKLIDGVLEYTKADSNISADTLVDTNLVLTELLKISNLPPNIVINYSNLPSIRGNKNKIEQVFDNFISNAIQYNKAESAQIDISSTAEKNAFYRFEIKDNGVGIDSKYHNSIFDMFMSINESSNPENIGIGLAINKKIIESHGGNIGCQSTIDEGSVFWFTWPV